MRVAVMGAGVSGLGAAYVLTRSGQDMHVFERDSRLGGHLNTIVHDGLALDTVFIDFNARNRPVLMRLFSARDPARRARRWPHSRRYA